MVVFARDLGDLVRDGVERDTHWARKVPRPSAPEELLCPLRALGQQPDVERVHQHLHPGVLPSGPLCSNWQLDGFHDDELELVDELVDND